MLIRRRHLEEALGRVRARVRDPEAGIHGPGSAAWQLQRESLCFVGGGRAALLQLAHPYVAYGVDQHSRTRADLQGRFQRTFHHVFAMTFGTLDDAMTAARRVHTIHTRIHGRIEHDVGAFRRGHRYHANESSALKWVYATLIDTVMHVHELLYGALPIELAECYYQDSKSFAFLFGIPDAELPADVAGFSRYVREMIASDVLAVAPPARDMAGFLFRPPRPWLGPAARWYRGITAGLLPERLRAEFGLRFGRRERLAFRASVAALRSGYRALPRPVRQLPAYASARRRLAGREPSPLATWIDRRVFQS